MSLELAQVSVQMGKFATWSLWNIKCNFLYAAGFVVCAFFYVKRKNQEYVTYIQKWVWLEQAINQFSYIIRKLKTTLYSYCWIRKHFSFEQFWNKNVCLGPNSKPLCQAIMYEKTSALKGKRDTIAGAHTLLDQCAMSILGGWNNGSMMVSSNIIQVQNECMANRFT